MSVKVRAWAGCLPRRDVLVACQRVACDAESLGSPSECDRGSVKLGFRHRLLLEIPFTDDEEVAGGVVFGVGVARQLDCPQFKDVAVAVDAQVIRDVDPPRGCLGGSAGARVAE